MKAEKVNLYGDAHPYIDEPLTKIKKRVRQLGGLKPEENQEQLHDLLAKVGERADDLLRKLPNLTSDEAVSETQRKDPSAMSDCIGEGCAHLSTMTIPYPLQIFDSHPERPWLLFGPDNSIDCYSEYESPLAKYRGITGQPVLSEARAVFF